MSLVPIVTALYTALICCGVPVAARGSPSNHTVSVWPVGDPNRCLEMFFRSNQDIVRFEVFPGLGWDNLRNVEASQVVGYTFQQCKLTPDGRYLIPDDVFTVPLKTSRVEMLAEIIDQWQNTSSLTARTINLNAGLSHTKFSISGKYSSENTQLKSKQIQDKAVTTRVKLQYNSYEAKLQPSPTLSPQFKSYLLEIGARVQLNQTDMARYHSQLTVRDFGTHVLTSVTAGAALVKDDFIKRDYIATHLSQKTSILASASASFFKLFKTNFQRAQTTSTTEDQEYSTSLTYSHVSAYGGSKVLIGDMTIQQWTDGVDANLVPMDRTGDPLYFLITPQTLPELPDTLAIEVAAYVRRAIEIYYEMNVIAGCTRQDSPQFSPLANFDDGSCTPPPPTTTFGGVYQTCSVSGQYLHTNPCSGMTEVNPKTGGYTCESGYIPVEMFHGSQLGREESSSRCHSCGFLWLKRCCRITHYQATANYRSYWCAAVGGNRPQSGYLFGGLYTSTSVNLVNGIKGCPNGFLGRKLLVDLTVCVSDDFSQSRKYSVPFGGFFTCMRGNPLTSNVPWPKQCPQGYSQHLATLAQGCSIHYCVESGALSSPQLPLVRRPPFTEEPVLPLDPRQTEEVVVINLKTQDWLKDEEAQNFIDKDEGRKKKRGLSSGDLLAVASVLSVSCTLAVVCGVILVYRRYQKGKVCDETISNSDMHSVPRAAEELKKCATPTRDNAKLTTNEVPPKGHHRNCCA